MKNDIIKKLKNFTVVYAEDEIGVRNNIAELLSLMFKKVYICSNGSDAYEHYKFYKPDLLITDIKMSELDGIELIKKIRQNDKNIDILITSAHTEVDYMLEAVELGLTRYIVKPITQEKLFDALEKFLENIQEDKVYKLSSDIEFDPKRLSLRNKEDLYELTKKEARFLTLLLNDKNFATYEEIEQNVWNEEYDMTKNALRLLAKNLRKKLPEGVLKNVQGIGYKLEMI